MKKYLTLSTSAAVFSALFLITGCSSSDDGGSTAASVPANAIVIDSANAELTVASAASTASTLSSAIAVETTQVLSLKSALNTIQPILKNISTANVATGIDFSEPCTDGGSISGSETTTDDGTTFTSVGTASFNNCTEGGLTINGSVSFSDFENYVTGAFKDDVSGSLNMTFDINGSTGSFNFSNFVSSVSGNNLNFTFTISQLTYAIDFVIDGTQGGGFLVSLIAPIVESNGDSCPESGHILITGGNNTTAEGIYNGDGTMTIKANGVIVRTDASCYA